MPALLVVLVYLGYYY